MKTFTFNSFKGHWPVGTAAVVCADSREDAAQKLSAALIGMGLDGKITALDMIQFPLHERDTVRILCDGNY